MELTSTTYFIAASFLDKVSSAGTFNRKKFRGLSKLIRLFQIFVLVKWGGNRMGFILIWGNTESLENKLL